MPLRAGHSLSFYEILGPLGAGGQGEVYRARDTRLDREVAINRSNQAHVCGIDPVEATSFISIVLRDLTNIGTARLALDR